MRRLRASGTPACCRFFFNDTATTEIYTLSLHDALPICPALRPHPGPLYPRDRARRHPKGRSEEHTSELQSHVKLVCRLLLEKKNEVPVVVASKVPEAPMPKRVSLPSMLPPAWSAQACWSTPVRATTGFGCCSAVTATATEMPQSRNITAKIAHPWRREP